MDIQLLLTVFALGFLGSFLAGMLGIGGSVILYPVLLFVPPLIGVGAFTAHEVAGIGAVQSLFASISGTLAYKKGGFLHKSLIIYMGTSVLLGSLVGSTLSNSFSEDTINLIYGVMATIAAILMFTPKKPTQDENKMEVWFSKKLAVPLSLAVGICGGIVGAGGAFLLVPIMITILKIPVRVTIASSLAVTFLSSIGTTFGKVATGQVLVLPALMIIGASLLAAPIGAFVGQKTKVSSLQVVLAVVITATSLKIWFDLLKKSISFH
ncbi:sulfite exporter TauE/SafE family protein [Priestia flexa]|uniref:sulfite exporter TauE/SafE family protein n=1 Tax=Priestia flexa TaxID=86664 RepID=UPI003D90D2BE